MAIEAMNSAYSSHGKILTSNPAQDAWLYHGCDAKLFKALQACKDALAETQEPVLYIDGGGLDGHATWAQAIRCQDTDIALYTTPSREWQSLSDDEIWDIANFLGKNKEWDYPVMFAKTIEKALKEKNG